MIKVPKRYLRTRFHENFPTIPPTISHLEVKFWEDLTDEEKGNFRHLDDPEEEFFLTSPNSDLGHHCYEFSKADDLLDGIDRCRWKRQLFTKMI